MLLSRKFKIGSKLSRRENKLSSSLTRKKEAKSYTTGFGVYFFLHFQFKLNSSNETEELKSLADKDSKHLFMGLYKGAGNFT